MKLTKDLKEKIDNYFDNISPELKSFYQKLYPKLLVRTKL